MGIRTMGMPGRYLIHGRDGRIMDNQNIGRCLARDRVTDARTAARPGYGNMGDQMPMSPYRMAANTTRAKDFARMLKGR